MKTVDLWSGRLTGDTEQVVLSFDLPADIAGAHVLLKTEKGQIKVLLSRSKEARHVDLAIPIPLWAREEEGFAVLNILDHSYEKEAAE